MTSAPLHSTPPWRDVLLALIRAAGFALRKPAVVAGTLLAIATILVAIEATGGRGAIPFRPEQYALPSLMGLLLPVGVWMGEERFGADFLWTLPVDRRSHALAKVFAGWLWLIAAIAILVLWLLVVAFITGGNVLAEETRSVLPSFSFAADGTFEPGAVQRVQWVPKPEFWLVPFTGATATYLFASALALGTRNPLRWVAGAAFGFFLFVGIAEASNADGLIKMIERSVGALLHGSYGVDAVLSAKTESLQVEAKLSTGETLAVWRGLPDTSEWATATLLWTAAGLAALFAAASRHKESR